MECVFCKIRDRKLAADFEYESDSVMAFSDINPAAEVHILVVPKEHIQTFLDLSDESQDVLNKIFRALVKLIGEKKLENKYRILCNGGALQLVPHLHFHLLGGKWFKDVAGQHDAN